MTHIIRTTLSSDALTELDNLKSAVPFVSNAVRLGSGSYSNLSKYEFSKWKTWTRTQRSAFKSCFESQDIDKSVIGYFLKFPANVGKLDRMNAWSGQTVAGTIVAYSLSDNNAISIETQDLVLQRGQGVEFSLTRIHSVATSSAERNWACLMLMK